MITRARCGIASGFELVVTEEAIRADFDTMDVGASRSVVVPFSDTEVGNEIYSTLEPFANLYVAQQKEHSRKYEFGLAKSSQAPGSVSLNIRRVA